ncbi:MAG: hypothetical protein OQK73_00355 [Gammaproteobacteria bacterium]|nr:hypothetical protein [Gammaproteobacteria bacterium]
MRIIIFKFAKYIVLMVLLVLNSESLIANENNMFRNIDDINIHIGLISVDMIQGGDFSAEYRMHGGMPLGKNKYHLVVALLDEETGEHIVDAKVSVKIAAVGLSGVTKEMEKMKVNGSVTFGNYFVLPRNLPYRILVTIDAENKGRVQTVFNFDKHLR